MKKDHLKTQLLNIVENEPNTLKAFVAQEALEQEDIKVFFSDLQQHGCISGMISPLIYYSDTHQFFDDITMKLKTYVKNLKIVSASQSKLQVILKICLLGLRLRKLPINWLFS